MSHDDDSIAWQQNRFVNNKCDLNRDLLTPFVGVCHSGSDSRA